MRVLPVVLCACLFAAACSEPPHKEMNQAQGAIDAARAAGAAQYAKDDFTAATTALQQSQDAVEQRDYRLALSRALDARERAQEAAKQAADGKALARSEAEAEIGRTTTALRQLQSKIATADGLKIPARDLRGPRDTASSVEATLQKAGAAVRSGDYLEATAAVRGTTQTITAQIGALDRAIAARPQRPPRRRK